MHIKDYISEISIVDSRAKYNGGICIVTSYLAKGLEFDAVIISNVNEFYYNSNKVVDMKLLYVSMTRALHELKILYNGNITRPLKEEI